MSRGVALVVGTVVLLAASSSRAQEAECLAMANDPSTWPARNDALRETPALTMTFVASGAISSGGPAVGGAVRLESFALRPLFLAVEARAYHLESSALVADAVVGLVYSHDYGTLWAPAGSSSWDTTETHRRVVDESDTWVEVEDTTITTTHTISWDDHCELRRRDAGIIAGFRTTVFDGDDADIPELTGAAELGWMLRRSWWAGFRFVLDFAIAGLYAPPGLAGDRGDAADRGAFGVRGRFALSVGAVYFALDAGGLFAQYGYGALDTGVVLEL